MKKAKLANPMPFTDDATIRKSLESAIVNLLCEFEDKETTEQNMKANHEDMYNLLVDIQNNWDSIRAE